MRGGGGHSNRPNFDEKQTLETVSQTARPRRHFSKVDHVVALDTVSRLIIQVNTVGTFLMKESNMRNS